MSAVALVPFSQAYAAAAVWADLWDEAGELVTDGDASELTFTARRAMAEDCRRFIAENAADLEGLDPEQAGHDFWLTRNHHGAGFWDRGLGELGDRLTAAAHRYGERSLLRADGRIELL